MGTNEDHPDYCFAEQSRELLPQATASAAAGSSGAAAKQARQGPLGTAGATVFEEICAIVGGVFEGLASNRKHFFATNNCYELFGFDFMVDDAMRVWLLEANPDPSMKMYGRDRDSVLCKCSPLCEVPPESVFRRVYERPKPQFSLKAALARLRQAGAEYNKAAKQQSKGAGTGAGTAQ